MKLVKWNLYAKNEKLLNAIKSNSKWRIQTTHNGKSMTEISIGEGKTDVIAIGKVDFKVRRF